MAEVLSSNQRFPFQYINSVGTWGNLKDFNLATRNGWYNVSGTTAEGSTAAPSNSPSKGGYGIMFVLSENNHAFQIFFGVYNDSPILARVYTDNSWSAWRTISYA